MRERTGYAVFIILLFVWLTIASRFASPPFLIIAVAIMIAYIIYNLIASSVSFYFRLVRKTKQEWHLQKNILPSFLLLSRNSPRRALKKLYRDMIENALPASFAKIPEGHTLVVITHLVSPSVLKYLPLKPEYIEIKPSKLQKVLTSIGLWLSTVLRFILRKGWYKPKFHKWYRLTIKK
ncbi:hypothetical protein MOOTH_15490 [Moorella thermoacetica]|nr:hypothetical protein MOOTH_15490 [Moorella thermoacetica]